MRIIAFAAATAPAIIILFYFLEAARVRMFSRQVWSAFGFGACAVFLALFVAFGTSFLAIGEANPYLAQAHRAFLQAAVPEETAKFLALLTVIGRRHHEVAPNRLFILAIAVAVGFACLENIFYVLEGSVWAATAAVRSISAVPGHAFGGAVMGFCVVRARAGRHNSLWWFLALIVPIGLHGTYDFFLFMLSETTGLYATMPQKLSGTFIALFMFVFLIEAALAHLALISVIRSPRAVIEKRDRLTVDPIARGTAKKVDDGVALWRGLGVICFLGCFFIVSMVARDISADSGNSWAGDYLMLGFALFTCFHGVAFFGLAKIIVRRGEREK